MATSALRLARDTSPLCEGDEFSVRLTVDAPGEAINAVQAAITFDPAALEVVSVRHGDSIIRYWAESPAESSGGGAVAFAGGLPTPGFIGANGKLVSVVFRALRDGDTKISVSRDSVVLLDDGYGTNTVVSFGDLEVPVSAEQEQVCAGLPERNDAFIDVTPPEPFAVQITRTEKAFNGDWFAAFETTDTGTGISYYEVRESGPAGLGSWGRAESPYRLYSQGGKVQVLVRAVDGAGNARTASASAELTPMEAPIMAVGDSVLVVGAIVLAVILVLLCRPRERD